MEKEEFGSAIVNDQMLVTRHLSPTVSESGHYFVQAKAYKPFTDIRSETNGTTKRARFNAIAKDLDGLEAVKLVAEVDEAMSAWEKANENKLELEKIRGFFGAPNVAAGKLRKKTSVHLLPAVQDINDETDSKRGPIINLLSEIAKQTIENRKEISDFLDRSKAEFLALSDPTKIPSLANISDLLTHTVRQFYADSAISTNWMQDNGLSVEYPKPTLTIENGGVFSELNKVGHGLQRATLFSIVDFLARTASAEQSENEFTEAASDIILLIEEPEIFQHPSVQIAMYDVFRRLTESFNKQNGIRVQLAYTTHSEKMIRMDQFDVARIVRKDNSPDGLVNSVLGISLSECSKAFANFFIPAKIPMSDDAFAAKLHIFTREICEGFFAKKIILVEGQTDVAILEGVLIQNGRSHYSEGLSIIAVDGKNKMDKPAYIFPKLGIKTYIVFDNDKKNQETDSIACNRRLQTICGEENLVDWPMCCQAKYTALEGDIESYLRQRIGEKYKTIFDEVASNWGLTYKEIKKTPAALSTILTLALHQGVTFPLFDDIIKKVDEL